MILSAKNFLAAHAVVALVAGCCSGLASGAAAVADEASAAGGFVIRAWGTEAGLPQNTVSVMLQTRDGYLWLGTHGGLARWH